MPNQPNAASYLVDRHVDEGRGDRIAFVTSGKICTYQELQSLVNRAGNWLLAEGVTRGDRVMLCLTDGVRFPALFFGALKIGAVPVPINTLLVAADYRYLIADSMPKTIVVSAALLPAVIPALGDAGTSARVFVDGPADARFLQLGSALDTASAKLAPVPVTDEDPGFILYSSGSTGGPKGVVHRQSSLLYTARLYADQVLALTDRDVIFSASKLFFAYGLGNSCTFPLHAGAKAILLADRPTPESVLEVLRRHEVTVFSGFPTLYAAILASTDDAAEPLPKLRLCVSAGEALPATLGERWAARFGVEILDGIGSTEALHIFISNRSGNVQPGASGKAVDGYQVSIRDENGAETATDQLGDLWCRGPSITSGYWRKPEATQRTLVDGWLRTGDKYYRDSAGYYHYAGRADDMLKVGGVWVSPHEIESTLMEHPAVLEAAVIAHRDENQLVRPKAFVVLKDRALSGEELAQALRAYVKSRIAPYKQPEWIEFRSELPKTATGKIRRNLLRAPQ